MVILSPCDGKFLDYRKYDRSGPICQFHHSAILEKPFNFSVHVLFSRRVIIIHAHIELL